MGLAARPAEPDPLPGGALTSAIPRRTFGSVNRANHPVRLSVGVTLLLLVLGARASVELGLGVEDIQGEGWAAQGLTISLVERSPGHLAVAIAVRHLELPDAYGSLDGLHLECPALRRGGASWECADGKLMLEDSPLQAQHAGWQGSYRPGGELRLVIPRLSVGQGAVALELMSNDGAWSARVEPYRVSLLRLATLSPAVELPAGWQLSGRASGVLKLQGDDAALAGLDAELVFDQVSYASPDGTQAAEKLILKADLSGRVKGAAWAFDARLGWPRGALYSEPLFLDADQGPVDARLTGSWEPLGQRLVLDGWSVELAKTAYVSGTGRFEAGEMRDLTVAAHSEEAGRLYQRLLQPFLIGSAADDMDVVGRVGLALHFDEQGIEQAGLELNRVGVEDRRGRFSLERSNGSVAWDRGAGVPVSRLDVSGASLYRIPIGRFGVRAAFSGDRIELLEPIVVPVLGGEVALDSFQMSGALAAGARPTWKASASLRDVSLEQLTQVLEWPPFGGVVSGKLREMRYADQVFTIGGGLDFSAFDGDVRVDDLSIQDPLGSVPILRANATLRGLSLEALTQTFSFGLIEGRLDGDLQDLQLVGWQPAYFSLHLYTSPGSDARRRISQRAVENLTELGSGIPAGLSSTVLQVFDQFRYNSIDLRVSLDGEVALLDGLARPDGGYYLVKGAGLPRIDVIGRNRSVAWRDLVKRLQQIQVEGAQIQ
jgi:hypothetical protein